MVCQSLPGSYFILSPGTSHASCLQLSPPPHCCWTCFQFTEKTTNLGAHLDPPTSICITHSASKAGLLCTHRVLAGVSPRLHPRGPASLMSSLPHPWNILPSAPRPPYFSALLSPQSCWGPVLRPLLSLLLWWWCPLWCSTYHRWAVHF